MPLGLRNPTYVKQIAPRVPTSKRIGVKEAPHYPSFRESDTDSSGLQLCILDK
jgi:hypothetical protein